MGRTGASNGTLIGRFAPLLPGMVPGLMLGGAVLALVAVVAVPSSGEKAARAQCDRAVAAMLESRDPVELQRADMLIRHLDCLVRKRLPR